MLSADKPLDVDLSTIVDALVGIHLDIDIIQCVYAFPESYFDRCKTLVDAATKDLSNAIKPKTKLAHDPLESKVFDTFCRRTLKEWHDTGMLTLNDVIKALKRKRAEEDKNDDFNQRIIAAASKIRPMLQENKITIQEKLVELANKCGLVSADADENPLFILRAIMRKRLAEIEKTDDSKDEGCLPSTFDELLYENLPRVALQENELLKYSGLYVKYYKAELAYFSAPANSLGIIARQICDAVEKAINKESMTECYEYVELLMRTKRAMETIGVSIADDTDNIKRIQEIAGPRLEQKRQTSWKSIIGGLALAFLGALLVFKSYALLAVSSGSAAPISMLGFTLGNTMLTAGFAWAGITMATMMSLFGLGAFVNETLKCTENNKTDRPPVRGLAFRFTEELAKRNVSSKAETTIHAQKLVTYTVV